MPLSLLLLVACGTRPTCSTASDCRLIADYCACTCRAGLVSERDPTCATPCQTLVPLCQGQLAALCIDGTCVAR